MLKEEEEVESLVLEKSGWHFPVVKPETSRYAITGHESQVLTIELPPGDSALGEPGVMMYLSPNVSQTAEYSGCCERACAGECCWVVNFQNKSSTERGYAALTPNFPTAKVIAVDMSSTDVGGVLVTQQGAYMASHGEVKVGISLDCNFVRCCCAGMGVVRQKLEGQGTAFLEATGTIVQKVLAPGEVIVADTNCVLAFADSCKLDIQRAGNIVGMIGGGEGIFNTTLTGPGLVILQSMNDKIFLQSLVAQKIYRR